MIFKMLNSNTKGQGHFFCNRTSVKEVSVAEGRLGALVITPGEPEALSAFGVWQTEESEWNVGEPVYVSNFTIVQLSVLTNEIIRSRSLNTQDVCDVVAGSKSYLPCSAIDPQPGLLLRLLGGLINAITSVFLWFFGVLHI